MRVVVFGTYDERRHPRIAVLAEGLRSHGVVVEECNHPLAVDTASHVSPPWPGRGGSRARRGGWPSPG